MSNQPVLHSGVVEKHSISLIDNEVQGFFLSKGLAAGRFQTFEFKTLLACAEPIMDRLMAEDGFI